MRTYPAGESVRRSDASKVSPHSASDCERGGGDGESCGGDDAILLDPVSERVFHREVRMLLTSLVGENGGCGAN